MRIQVKEASSPTGCVSKAETAIGSNDPVKIFFDVAYFLCISPFRLTANGGNYSVVRWIPQQIICGFITTLCFIFRALRIRHRIVVDHSKDATALMETSREIISAAFITSTLLGFWVKKDIYVQIVNARVNTTFPSNVSSMTTTRLFRTCFILGLLLILIASDLVPDTLITSIKCYGEYARFIFFQVSSINCTVAKLEPASSMEYMWAFAVMLLMLYSYLGLYTCSTCLFAHVWSLQDMISDRTTHWMSRSSQELFSEPIHDRWAVLWQEIIHDLQDTAKQVGLVNTAISTHLAMYIAEQMFYFPVHIARTLRPDGVAYGLGIINSLIHFLVTLLISAEVKAKVRECINVIANQTYLSEGWAFPNFPSHIVSITMDQISVKFGRRYDLDYGFLGAFFGFFFTLYVICSGHVGGYIQ